MKKYLKWMGLSAFAGMLAGVAAAIFLWLLDWATQTRDANTALIYFLPVAGFVIGWVYHRFGKNVARGNHLVLDEIHHPQAVLPLRMAPLVLFGTVITHLFGGSAGREGTVVQMGATLADAISKFFKVANAERKILLVAGAGAGFAAAVGAPWAGIIFGMEVICVGRLKIFAPVECAIAAFVAVSITHLLRSPHSHYPAVEIPDYRLNTLFFVFIAGLVFGLAAWVFVRVTHRIEKLQSRWISYPPFRPLVAGIILSALFSLPQLYPYAGLGIGTIQRALTGPAPFTLPLLKTFFTALTVGSGFKGGEFIPMVFIGTTLGSALSTILPVSGPLLAAVGFAAVFSAGAKTPWACTIMAMEIFGLKSGPYALVGCMAAYIISGTGGIYKGQRIAPRYNLFGTIRKLTKRYVR